MENNELNEEFIDNESDLSDENYEHKNENKESDSESEVAELNEKIKKLENDLAFSRADFYNYRQRTTKERQELRKHAQEDLIISILPVLDNLDRALDAADSNDTKSIITGVDMVRRQFLNLNFDGIFQPYELKVFPVREDSIQPVILIKPENAEDSKFVLHLN